ncbi:MAG: hypothetical protein MUC78_07095 [Bacteroidales bacterium]|nr:hypothetical protein [Bacteroidales bacterium]
MKLEDAITSPGAYDSWLLERISGTTGFSREELFMAPLIPDQAEQTAYREMIFDTPSGKIELYSETAEKLWGVNPLPSYNPPDDFGQSYLPFRLMTPNIASRIHSQFGNLEVIKGVIEPPAWEMSQSDAHRLGIRSGDRIRVYNNNGEVTGRVRVSTRIKKGSIVFPNGIWLDEGGGVNDLITAAETDMGHGAAFHNSRVGVEKA